MTIEEQAGLVKLASPKLAGTTGELRDQALLAVAKALMDNKDAIFDANRQDMEQAEKDGIQRGSGTVPPRTGKSCKKLEVVHGDGDISGKTLQDSRRAGGKTG